MTSLLSCDDAPPERCRKPVGWMDERLAVLADGVDAWRCVVVGDDRNHSADALPSPAWLGLEERAPVVYVQAGAGPGGDGTRARPFASLDAALRGPAATVVLSRGRHRLSSAVTVTDVRQVVGAGTDDAGTVLELARNGGGLVVDGAAGSLTLAGVHLEHPAPTTAREPQRELALVARGGARLTLRSVLVSRAGSAGVLVEGADSTLDAERVTVREAAGNGVTVRDGARAALRRASVFRNGYTGVFAEAAHVHLVTSLVAGNAQGGVQLRGAADTAGGAERCGDAGPDGAAGALDCFREASITCNGIAGLVASGGRALDLRRSVVSDTRAGSSRLGHGISVLDGARVVVDGDLGAVEGDVQPHLGRGTRVLASERTGVLVSGATAAGLASTLDARGAAVTENGLGGIVVQSGASVQTLQAVRVAGNLGVGIALTDTTRASDIVRCTVTGTRMGAFQTDRGTIVIGDGLSMATATGMNITASRFDDNARFGVLLRGARAVVARNVGARNGFGLGNYAPVAVTLEANDVRGLSRAPDEAPPVAMGP